MKIKRKWLLFVVPAGVIGVFGLLGLHRNNQSQYLTAKVERGDIRDAVEATGTVNAVTTVQVGSQVSGTIARLNADFNSRVSRGEVLALIDPAMLRGALRQAVADLQNAEANRAAARANLEKAKASLVQMKAEYNRTATLAKGDMVSQQQLEIAKATFDGANASVTAAAANVEQAKAQISQKAAAVSVAQTNLNYTVIRSPIDGIVVARNVDVGQTVAASLQAPTIFTIAQDLAKMQVYGKVDESDVGRIKVNEPVTFKVDAFPKQTFHGAVRQIRMNPTVVQNVVTYDAVIDFGNPELKLFPGMTAYVTIPVATAANVLKLPDAALQYKPSMPPDEIRALYRKYGIEADEAGGGSAKPEAETHAGRPGRAGRGVVMTTAGSGAGGGRSDVSAIAPSTTAVVWELEGGNAIRPVKVALGITDHAFTVIIEVLKGELKEGDEVVTRSVLAKTTTPTGQGIRR